MDLQKATQISALKWRIFKKPLSVGAEMGLQRATQISSLRWAFKKNHLTRKELK